MRHEIQSVVRKYIGFTCTLIGLWKIQCLTSQTSLYIMSNHRRDLQIFRLIVACAPKFRNN